MKRISSWFAAAGAVALLAPGAFAQMNSSGMRTGSSVGTASESFETVVRVDRSTNQIVVQSPTGQQRVVVLNNATTIQRPGPSGLGAPAMRIGDLTVGDRIAVSGAPVRGAFTAQRIRVLDTGAVGAPPPTGVDPAAPGAPDKSIPEVEDPARRPGAVLPGGASPTPGSPPGGANPTPGSPPGGGPAPGAPLGGARSR